MGDPPWEILGSGLLPPLQVTLVAEEVVVVSLQTTRRAWRPLKVAPVTTPGSGAECPLHPATVPVPAGGRGGGIMALCMEHNPHQSLDHPLGT